MTNIWKENKEKREVSIVITAIISLAVMECFALSQGINGYLLRWVTIVIAMLGGILIPKEYVTRWLK